MLSDKMLKALNDQINAEYLSSYIYLSMAAFFYDRNLPGFAGWMRVQAQEEMEHALKFYDYVNDRRGRITLTAIQAPPAEWASPLAAFQAAYDHEVKVTGMINNLVNLANAEKDHATASFLKWFVDEQVEEEAQTDSVVQQLRMIGDSKGSLFYVDRHLGKRKAGGGDD